MNNNRIEEVNVLKLTLHGREVGYLAGFQNGRNVLSFVDNFRTDPNRPTFSLITMPNFPRSNILMAEPMVTNQRLHPTLSNLLPEGPLRTLIAQGLKVHVDNEFKLLTYLGNDLPGALVVEAMEPDAIPESILTAYGKTKVVKFEKITEEKKYSLSGVQMKFSMKEKEGRYNISNKDTLGDWIIKTPSTHHKEVPLNEFTAMTLASLVGINIPEIRLVELSKLDKLPPIKLPDEKFAYAIKRFDREGDTRVHMEDFAQVLVKSPHDKYDSANYEQIGKIIYDYSGDGLADAQQFAKQLLVNILLANGDAHIKNWSLLYSDKITPRLSPAYDIVTTSVYIDQEKQYALNLGKNKDWYKVSYENFKSWAKHTNVPWQILKPHLDDAIEKARSLWPEAIKDLPMNETHKKKLKHHWEHLHPDFQIK